MGRTCPLLVGLKCALSLLLWWWINCADTNGERRPATFSYRRSKQTFIKAVSIVQTCEYVMHMTDVKISVAMRSSMMVECHMQAPAFREDKTQVFEPHENRQWPEGLEFCDTFVSVKAGRTLIINVSVQNPTNPDIILGGRTVIGTIRCVSSLYPSNSFKTDHVLTASVHHVKAQNSSQDTPALPPLFL